MNEPSDADVRALRHMVEELRASLPPELDWANLERKTFERIDREAAVPAGSARAARPSPFSNAVAIALAAAALLAIVVGQRAPEAPPSTNVVATVTSLEQLDTVTTEDGRAYLASSLESGSRVVTDAASARFTLPGVATWELGPHSSAVMSRRHGFPHLDLERGEVRARVVPRSDSSAMIEAMVVDAGTTRVAVHGTTFSVERNIDDVDVTVVEGVVTVGPAGQRGPAVGTLLRGPVRARFSVTGARLLGEQALDTWRPEGIAPPAAPTGEPTPSTGGVRPSATDDEALDAPAAEAIGEVPPKPGPAVMPRGRSTAPAARSARHASRMEAEDSPLPPSSSTATEAPSTEVAPPSAPRLTLGAVRQRLLACLSTSDDSANSRDVHIAASSEVKLRLDSDGRVAGMRFNPPLRPDLQARCAGSLFGVAVESDTPNPSVTVSFTVR